MYLIRSSSGAPDEEVQSSSGAHDGEASQCSSDDNMMNRRNPLERKVQREVRSNFVGTSTRFLPQVVLLITGVPSRR